MNFKNSSLILFTLILFACTKKVGKDPKLHPAPKPYESPYVGKYAVQVYLYNEVSNSQINFTSRSDTTFKDTMNITYNSSTGKTTFNYLHYMNGHGLTPYSESYSISPSGTYSNIIFLSINFRHDSLFYTYDYLGNRIRNIQLITGKKIK
jgi:hypothetical protein